MQKPFNAKQIHILNVAEELIAQNGFENTSVREISKNANINVAMISYYFGSKEKMMTCLYEYRIQRSKEKFSELTQILGNIKPEIQIKEIINFVVGEVLKYTHLHQCHRKNHRKRHGYGSFQKTSESGGHHLHYRWDCTIYHQK